MYAKHVSSEPLLSLLNSAYGVELKMIGELKKYLDNSAEFPVIRSEINRKISLSEQIVEKIGRWIEIVKLIPTGVNAKDFIKVYDSPKDFDVDTSTEKEYIQELEAFKAMTPYVLEAEKARTN